MKIIITETQINYLVNNVKLNKLKKELLFQYKLHELRLNMFEYDSEKENYFNSIKKTYTPYFEKNKTIISEYYSNFKSNLIFESFLTVNEKLKKYFNFISSSFLLEFKLITKPQYFDLLDNLNNNLILQENLWDDIKSGAEYVGNKVVSGVKDVTNKIGQAWNYVKSKGVSFIMDGIRNALDSGVGTAVQTFLSFTGVGNIATAVVWGVMALYDLYMYIKGNVSSPLNLIMSVLGAISTGVLSPLLKPFKTALSGLNMSQIFTKLFTKLPVLKNWVTKIASGAGFLLNKMKEGAVFASKYLGISWLSSTVSSASKWISSIVKSMTAANIVVKNTVKKVIQFVGSKMGTKVSEYLVTAAGKKMANTLSKATIETINKELLMGKLKDYGENEVYSYVDKKYGKTYGNLIRVANGKKPLEIVKNLATGNLA